MSKFHTVDPGGVGAIVLGKLARNLPIISTFFKTKKRAKITVATGAAIALWYYYKKKNQRKQSKASSSTRSSRAESTEAIVELASSLAAKKKGKKVKVGVDKVFWKRMAVITKILVPSWTSKEAMTLLAIAFFKVLRTLCDLFMVNNGGRIASAVNSRDKVQFWYHVSLFACASPVFSCVNNTIKFLLSKLTVQFRTRLTQHLHNSYLQGNTAYQVSNLDNRISNPDQLLTQDVDKFCSSLSELYSNLSKPILDIVIFSRKLAENVGAAGPFSMIGYFLVAGAFTTRLRQPVGRFTAAEQNLEGEFRFCHSRLITHSEEIAFYQGQKREKGIIDASFKHLKSHLDKVHLFKAKIGVVESVVAKYSATLLGYFIVSWPIFDFSNPRYLGDGNIQAQIAEDYSRNVRVLFSVAGAVGQLILCGRELTRLAGLTARVAKLLDVLNDVNNGKYERTMVTDGSQDDKKGSGDSDPNLPPLVPHSGNLEIIDGEITFDKVPIVTPNGDVLVRELSFSVRSGMNLMIAGPNGCGKSSLFRILGDLWPLFGGTLRRPDRGELFYVPQRPYLALGTLRDQIIYPHSASECSLSEAELLQILERVHLGYILDRDGGFDAVQDWQDVLSGGEKQRMAMARLFYHKPQFAILDECTSAVSVDVEGEMYTYAREIGITLFTVSHRKSLWQYHEFVLRFDGSGSYSFLPIDANTEQFGS